MDLERIALAARNDPAAEAILVRELQWRLHRYMCRWIGSADDDITQETIAAVHRRLHVFEDRGSGSFMRWAYGFVRNLVSANHRSRSRQIRAMQALAGHVPTPGTSLTSLVDRCERLEILEQERDSLVPAHQRAIDHDLAGGDARGLAEIERISVAAARVLQSRARGKLRRLVGVRMMGARPKFGGTRAVRSTRLGRSSSSSSSPQASH